MLTKLIKYEWKATSKSLLPLYLVLIIMTFITRGIFALDIFQGSLTMALTVFMLLYFMSLIALVATTFILIILRFYKNLLTGEGYLMFTLPVTVRDLILSKLILSFFWVMICVVICFASLMFVIPSASKLDPAFATFTFRHILDFLGTFDPLYIALVAITIIAGLITNILLFYASIALGQMISKNKVMGSVIAYIGLYMVNQVVGIIFLITCTILNIDINDVALVSRILIGYGLGIFVIGGIALYSMTSQILRKRLNLE